MAAAPASSRTFANSAAFLRARSMPARIFTVTGFFTREVMARTIWPASSGSRMRAEPSPFPKTFGTGQPMLKSMTSQGPSSRRTAISPQISGSEPKSCTARGRSSGIVRSRSAVPRFLYHTAFALTISVTAISHPCSRQRIRKGRSETPAMGARMIPCFSSSVPIFILSPSPLSGVPALHSVSSFFPRNRIL